MENIIVSIFRYLSEAWVFTGLSWENQSDISLSLGIFVISLDQLNLKVKT